jgi:hypothetical protein
VELKILEPAEMPPNWATAQWTHHGVGTAPARLAAIGADPRWRVRYATAWESDRLVGVLPMCRPGAADIWDQDYDLSELVTAPIPADARAWLLLGGCRDLAGGFLVAAGAPDELRARLAGFATETGRAEGLTVAALYIRDAELPAFAARGSAFSAGETAILALPPGLDDYLTLLPRKRRNKIRRDWRDFAEAGLASVTLPVDEAIETGAELVTAVKRRHGIADHPRITAMRLRRWHGLGLGEYAAFGVRDAGDRLLAVCFVVTVGRALDVHEIGLTDDEKVRLPTYLEAGFYAPIGFALDRGCTAVEFGGAALATKRARGAHTEPLWTVLLDE